MLKEITAVRIKRIDFLRNGLVEIYEQKRPVLRDKGSLFMIFRKKRDQACTLLLDGMARGALKCQLNPSAVLESIFGHSERKKVEMRLRQGKGMVHFVFN